MERLKYLRESRNLTIRELARKTNLDPSTLSKIETGKRNMGMKYAQVLAEFFNVSINYIMGKSLDGVIDDFFNQQTKDYNRHEINPLEKKISQDKLDCMDLIRKMDEKLFLKVYKMVQIMSAENDYLDLMDNEDKED